MHSFTPIPYISSGFSEEKTSEYRLVVFLQPSKVYYVVLSQEDKILLGKGVPNTQSLEEFEFIREVFESERLMRYSFRTVTIVTTSPVFTLIPSQMSSGRNDLRFARMLLEDSLQQEELAKVPMNSINAGLVFTFSRFINDICLEYWQPYIPSHISAFDLELTRQLASPHSDHLLLHVLGSSIIITAYKNGSLRLCNTFEYTAVLDIIYFLQSVCQATNLEIDHTPISIIGEFETDSKLFRELNSYLPNLSIPSQQLSHYRSENFEDEQEEPLWKYAFLASY